MTDQKKRVHPTSRSEKRIGNTVYRISSVYLGEKDLKHTLEQLAINRTLAEMSAGGLIA